MDVSTSSTSYLIRKLQLHVFPEPARVVVADGLCVAERLEDRVRLQQVPLHTLLGGSLHGQSRSLRTRPQQTSHIMPTLSFINRLRELSWPGLNEPTPHPKKS